MAGFGRPYPILVLTGGDCLLRHDIFDLVEYANGKGVPVAMSPSVTPQLTPEAIQHMVDSGVKAVSISLDGANAATHDGVRGIPGHFDKTIPAIRALVDAGLTVQINTTVMSRNMRGDGRHRGDRQGDRRRHLGGVLPGPRRSRRGHRRR